MEAPPLLGPGERIGLAVGGLLVLGAVGLLAWDPRHYELTSRRYVRFLLVPWKVGSFAVALAFFIVIAPYSGDPTWDWVDGTGMSVLTFLTAPFSVGVLARRVRGRATWRAVGVALGCWYLGVSYFYEVYLVARDGLFPPTWASNLLASSVLYVAAGLMWNLEDRPGRGVTFAFLEPEWLVPSTRVPWRVLAYATLFVLLVVGMMLPFIWSALRG